MLNSERQAEVSDEQLRIPTKPIYSSWYFIMAHTLWGNSTNAVPVCHFEWQFVNVSILYRDHLIISSNMVVEEARILIRYLSPLSNATISSSRLFYVAPRARGTCDVSTVSSSAQDWNLQFIHDRLDGYVPNHIFSTTLASIHRRQSFIFYASHAAEHTWQWKLLPTNGHRLLLRSPSAINFAPKDFLNFFSYLSRQLWLHSHSTGVPVTWYSEHASCGIIFCGGVRNCIFGLLYSCHNVVAKQFQCVPFIKVNFRLDTNIGIWTWVWNPWFLVGWDF